MIPGRIRRAALLAGLAVVGAGLASCGGDGGSTGRAPSSADAPRASVHAPAEVTSSAGTSSQRKQANGSSGSSGSSSKHQARKAAEPSRAIDLKAAKQQQKASLGSQQDLDGAAAPDRSVCRLVSTSEATTILGTAVRTPVVAKQGPTCLYRTRKGDLTTVSVQAAALPKLTAHMRKQRNVAIGTRSGVCGTLGQPMLYLPVGGRKVLAVTGDCEVARQFATHALPRLTGP